MAKRGEIPQPGPNEPAPVAGVVERTDKPAEVPVFGEAIVAGDTPQPQPGAPDIAPSPEPGPAGEQGDNLPKTFIDSTWPQDMPLPEGLADYNTPQKLITAHEALLKKMGEQGKELGALRSDNRSLREGKQTEELAALRERAEKEIAEGGLTRDTTDALAHSTGWPAPIVALFGQWVGERADIFNSKASARLGGEENFGRFMDALRDSGQFTHEQLDTWNIQATAGDTSWLTFVAPQLGFTLVEQAAQPGPDGSPPAGAPAEPSPGVNREIQQLPVGHVPTPPGPDIFTTRAEYNKAAQQAENHYNETGESGPRDAVRAKLHRSPTQQWGDQVGG